MVTRGVTVPDNVGTGVSVGDIVDAGVPAGVIVDAGVVVAAGVENPAHTVGALNKLTNPDTAEEEVGTLR